MNLPNKLTLTRILLVPAFMIFVSLGQYITPSYNPVSYTHLDVYKRQSGMRWTACAAPSTEWPRALKRRKR